MEMEAEAGSWRLRIYNSPIAVIDTWIFLFVTLLLHHPDSSLRFSTCYHLEWVSSLAMNLIVYH